MQVQVAWYSVTDMARAKEFYSGVLGLKTIFEMQGWAEFSHAEGAVSIGVAHSDKPLEGSGGATVVLDVASIDQTRKSLAAKGVDFQGAVEEIPGVVRIATFLDPFGNRLQLAQSLLPKP